MVDPIPLSIAKVLPLAAVVVASIALVTSATRPAPPPEPPAQPPGQGDQSDISTSENWAGYVANSSSYTGVGASWRVPEIGSANRQSFATDAAWVGVGGVDSHDLVQVGTEAIVNNGTVDYKAWYEVLPDVQKMTTLKVTPGDSMSASVIEKSPGTWHLAIQNNTTGKRFEHDVAYKSTKGSAEWIEERPIVVAGDAIGYAPLATFGVVQFTDAYAIKDGVKQHIGDLEPHAVSMVSGDMTPLASPSMVTNGDSFIVAETPQAFERSQVPDDLLGASEDHRQYRPPRPFIPLPPPRDFIIGIGS